MDQADVTTGLTVPEPGTQLTLQQIESLEMSIAAQLPQIEDVQELQGWLAQVTALSSFVKRRDLQGPIMGAQRRIEARIGQLLPPPQIGRNKTAPVPEEIAGLFPHRTERYAFSLLGRAAKQTVISDEEWRQPRKALVTQVRLRLGDRQPLQTPKPSPAKLLTAVGHLAEWTLRALDHTNAIGSLDDDQHRQVERDLDQVARGVHELDAWFNRQPDSV